jgi:hypothetical protein
LAWLAADPRHYRGASALKTVSKSDVQTLASGFQAPPPSLFKPFRVLIPQVVKNQRVMQFLQIQDKRLSLAKTEPKSVGKSSLFKAHLAF